ncbi:zinc finger MYM-type protein 4-like [Eucyclogobius newberryi]|uniref:zinc finger MYM-type protein 4-like n=1 Tax=Eucyclogobius newberryi TaxID=166745 RepID=UPI003B5C9A86
MAESMDLRLSRLKEQDARMSRMFDEVMGLGDFADSSRGSGSSSKSGQDESKVVEKEQQLGEQDSNCSRREEKMDEDVDESSPPIAPLSSNPPFTAGANAESGGAALDNAMDAPPPPGVEEDDDDWDFNFPLKSNQSKEGKSESQSETFPGDSREAEAEDNASSTSASTSASSVAREDENGRDIAARSSETDDSQQELPQEAPPQNVDPPLSPNVNIKEEPIDEEYDAALLPQSSIKDIKEELEQEEELRISSVFSVGGSNAFAHPSVAAPIPPPTQIPASTTFFLTGRGTLPQVMAPFPVRAPAPVMNTIPAPPTMPLRPPPPAVVGGVRCSGCAKILMKGQTAFQRKGSTQLFCSTVCLTGHLPLVTKSRTCFQCYKDILNPREMVTVSAENNTLMNFCGQFCLSVYKSKKKKVETDKLLDKTQNKVPVPEKIICSVCKVPGKIEHEVNHQGSLYKLCSDVCFVSWRKMKQLALNCCEGCGLYCNSNSGSCQTLMVDKSELNFCGPTCISTYKQTCRKRAECACCHKVAVVSSTVMELDQKGKVQLYCSNVCVEKSRPPKHMLSDTAFPCSHCEVSAVPQYHLAMVDGTIRNFCSLDCVSTYRKYSHTNLTNGTASSKELPVKQSTNPTSSKETISSSKDTSSLDTNHSIELPNLPPAPHKSEIPPASDPELNQTKTDALKIRLSCYNCKNLFKSKPQLLSHQGALSIFCSSACSFEYKTQKSIVGFCTYCKKEKVIYEKISNNEEDVCFCSEECKNLFKQTSSDNPCSYCSRFSSSKNVQSHYCGQMKGFCKPYCMSKYTVRYYGMARCDSCRKQGYMTENLQCMGSVRNFCNLSCLLQYCHIHFDKRSHSTSNGTGPEPRKLNGTSASSIENLKNVDHASTQTVGSNVPMPRRRPMKNKAILCRPITMDQEISCQLLCPPKSTDVLPPPSAPTEEKNVKYVLVPVAVPVFIPVPMNMYSQHTPVPMPMPVPVPVPIVVPPKVKEMVDAAVQFEEEPTRDEAPVSLTEENGNCDKPEPHSNIVGPVIDNTNEHEETTTTSDCALTHSELENPSSPAMDLEQDFPFASEQKGLAQRGVKRKRSRGQTASGSGSAVVSQTINLNHLYGIDAWKSWARQRNKNQPNEDPLIIEEDIFCCDSNHLSLALCCFIREVRRPSGDMYSPDSIFFLCLSLQQYLFMKGRIENIFNDHLYSQFASEITDILQHWKPTLSDDGTMIPSRIEESFLWECKQLGAYSPLVLLNTLLFFFTKHLGLVSVDEHAHLSFTNISLCSKPCSRAGRVSYLHYTRRRGPIQENTEDGRQEKEEETIELLENLLNPLHCPVRLYEFYLSRCPEMIHQDGGLFYVQPEQNVHTDSTVWYTCQPLNRNTLQSMLTQILAVREVQQQQHEKLK